MCLLNRLPKNIFLALNDFRFRPTPNFTHTSYFLLGDQERRLSLRVESLMRNTETNINVPSRALTDITPDCSSL